MLLAGRTGEALGRGRGTRPYHKRTVGVERLAKQLHPPDLVLDYLIQLHPFHPAVGAVGVHPVVHDRVNRNPITDSNSGRNRCVQRGIACEDIVEDVADRRLTGRDDAALGVEDHGVFGVVAESPVEITIVVSLDLLGDQTEKIGRCG